MKQTEIEKRLAELAERIEALEFEAGIHSSQELGIEEVDELEIEEAIAEVQEDEANIILEPSGFQEGDEVFPYPEAEETEEPDLREVPTEDGGDEDEESPAPSLNAMDNLELTPGSRMHIKGLVSDLIKAAKYDTLYLELDSGDVAYMYVKDDVTRGLLKKGKQVRLEAVFNCKGNEYLFFNSPRIA